jgi:23S rRNA (uracil1939-C5)-methyltransferase
MTATRVFVEALDHEGRGVAHDSGKAIFIDGALPGEIVTYSPYKKKPSYEFAQLVSIDKSSAVRTTPRCPHYGVCGGCNMQHAEFFAQVASKQRILEDNLARIGKVKPEVLLPPIYGPEWGYRQRARLSSRYVEKKGRVLVGFREKKSSFVAAMQTCEILPADISALIPKLSELLMGMDSRERIPQIEVACGSQITVLVVRHLEPIPEQDALRLKQFAEFHSIQFWLQPHGPESAHPFWPLDAAPLYYTLPEFDLKLYFSPTEFTQVNHAVNCALVKRAVTLLAPQPAERIADLFCGLGNFSLAIARGGATVIGLEGAPQLVRRATDNAQKNGLAGNTAFHTAYLFAKDTDQALRALGKFDKLLIDPPRDGAVELVKAIEAPFPSRIVYVSCGPATLARDAGVLVHTKGYVLKAAGVVNMFPHTGHVESIALFER